MEGNDHHSFSKEFVRDIHLGIKDIKIKRKVCHLLKCSEKPAVKPGSFVFIDFFCSRDFRETSLFNKKCMPCY